MTKKIISIFLVLIFLLTALCGCRAETPEKSDASSQSLTHSGGSNDSQTVQPAPETNADTEKETDSQTQTGTASESTSSVDASTDEAQPSTDADSSLKGEATPPSAPAADSLLTYEEYNALSADKQQEYFNSFETVEKFFDWYNAAKSEYEKNNQAIEIGDDGSIDLSEIADGKK